MLPKKTRLGTTGFKQKPLRTGRFLFGSFRIISAPSPMAAVVVSKKIAATAPERNHLRRRLYVALKPIITKLPVGTGIILYPTINARVAPLGVISAELEKVLEVR